MDCHPSEILAAFRDGTLPEMEREAVARHAVACARCRDILFLLGTTRQGEARRFPRLWAAAALVLVALGLGWVLHEPEGIPSPDPKAPPPIVLDFPVGSLGKELPSAHLARGADLVLEAGARVVSEGKDQLRAESGRFWLGVSRREPLSVALPDASLAMSQGEVVVALAPVRTSWLLQEAFAGDSSAQVWVLRGEVEIKTVRKAWKLGAGRKLVLGPEGWREERLPEQEVASLVEARAMAVAAAPGVAPSSDIPSAYRWVTVLEGRGPATELSLTVGVEGAWYQWTAGVAAFPPKAREAVEVTWDGEWLAVRVNGAPHFSVDREHLPQALRPASRKGWEVSAWGGSIRVLSSRLHPEGPQP